MAPMTLAELVASMRVDSDDKVAPWFTKEPDAVRFANEAEEEAAIRGRLLFDDTVSIVIPKGTRGVLPPRYAFTALTEITRATLYRKTAEPSTYATSGGISLYPISRDRMDRDYPDWRDDVRSPCVYIIDDTSIQLPCIVDRDYILRLEGYRGPIRPMSDSLHKPEIHPQHHRYLVHWMLYRAYMKPDSEIFNPEKSRVALAQFEDYFGYRPQANERHREQTDRDHRTTGYY